MKKILFIIPTLQGGGAEKLLTDILNDFNYDQYEVHLMYFYEENVYLSQIPSEVRRIVPFYIQSSVMAMIKRSLMKICHLEDVCRRRLIRNAADEHYDVIISFLHGLALHFHQFLIDRGDKHISFVHFDFDKADASYVNLASKEYAVMDTIAFVSENVKDTFQNKFPLNKSQHVVLPNFIDIDNIIKKSQIFQVKKTVPTFICVGRLEKEKGFDILVDIAKLLKKEYDQFLFQILGAGQEEKKLRELIRVNNLDDYFDFLGFQKNPYPYMANADIMLSTSYEEGFGLVICESIALGVPVISSRTAGAKSLLGNGVGLLVSRDAEEYVTAINLLIRNAETYQQYVRIGKERSRKHDKRVYMPNLYEIL